MEADEAGRLRAFREKFGRGWDAERMDVEDEEGGEQIKEESLMDLITGFGGAEGEKEESGKEGKMEVRERKERERLEAKRKREASIEEEKKRGEGGGY